MGKLIMGGLWFLSVLAGGLVGFLAAYLKKKGENLATHEDIEMLVDQVRAVTTATKEIEAKISGDVWDRQKRWEMKRDVLFEATKRLGAFEDALLSLHTTFLSEKLNRKLGEPEWFEAKSKASHLRVFARVVAIEISKNDMQIYLKSAAELMNKSIAFTTAIRKELEIDNTT